MLRSVLLLLLLAGAGVLAAADLPALMSRLKSSDVDERIAASAALAELGDAAAPAAGLLGTCLRDPYWDVRKNSARALGAMGEAALPILREELASRQYWRSLYAAEAAGRLGPAAAPLVGELGRLVLAEELEWENRAWAAWALAEIGPEAAPALPDLIAALERHPAGLTGSYIAEAIAGLGPAAEPAIPALLEAMQINPEAKTALARIGPPAIEAIVERARAPDADKHAVWAAIGTIGAMGEAAAPAVPWLLDELAPGRDQWFVAHVTRALGAIGPAAADAVPALRTVLTDHGYADARRCAAQALGRIGADDRATRAALGKALDDADAGVAAAAREVLECAPAQ